MRKKQKILYIITKSNQGGAQKNVYDLAVGLSQNNFDISVFAGGNGWLLDELSKKNIRAESLPFLARNINPVADISVLFHLIFLFKKERPDIIHLHSSKIGGIGALAARVYNLTAKSYKLKARIIFTAHGWAFNEKRFFIPRAFIWIASWVTVLLCDDIITITKKDTVQASSMPFISKSKIQYIPNGIGHIDFLPQSQAREILLGPKLNQIPQSALWLGTISELTVNKGLTYALEAIAILKKDTTMPPFIFVIIGEGEEQAMLEKQIKTEYLSDTVFLIGHKKDAQTLLKAFNIFTLTSLKEGLPYVILEAGLAGLPILATNVGGIQDIIKNKESGLLIEPKNSDNMAKSLKILTAREDSQKSYEKKIHETIKQFFVLENMRKRTYNLYKRSI